VERIAARTRKRVWWVFVALLSRVTTFSYGFVSGVWQVFPYGLIRSIAKNPARAMRILKAHDRAPLSPLTFDVLEDAFVGQGPQKAEAMRGEEDYVFDIVAADMDLDGTLDVLVNRHHLYPLELYRNLNGRFQRANVPGADTSGLFDNAGIPDLFGPEEETISRIQHHGAQGLYVWHDTDREYGLWRLFLKAEHDSLQPTAISVRFNSRINKVVGVGRENYELNADHLLLMTPLQIANRGIGVGVDHVAAQIDVTVSAANGTAPLPVFVGPQLIRVGAGGVVLWMPDPHGMAWADVAGSAEPDLFIARGALAGTLTPPHGPKNNLLYIWQGSRDALYQQADPGVIPPDYGRGRRVEWVDIDRDGVNELYIGNLNTPNALLVKQRGTSRYEDHASRLGINFVSSGAFTWFDINADGYDDLLFLTQNRVAIALNRGGAGFEVLDGERWGVRLPNVAPASEDTFDRRAFHVFDFDNDGSLDLLVSGWGANLTMHLFLGGHDHFTDVTERIGLNRVTDGRFALVADVDNDGFTDLITVGDDVVVLRNLNGGAVRPERLSVPGDMGRIDAAVSGDFDQNGRVDLILAGRRLYLLRGRVDNGNRFFRVRFEGGQSGAVGTLVRAFYGNGMIQVQRYGSSANSVFSQALVPLQFGIPGNSALHTIAIRWPGTTQEARYSVSGEQSEVVVRPQ